MDSFSAIRKCLAKKFVNWIRRFRLSQTGSDLSLDKLVSKEPGFFFPLIHDKHENNKFAVTYPQRFPENTNVPIKFS